MLKYCYTAAQIRFIKSGIVIMMGCGIAQSIINLKLSKSIEKQNIKYRKLYDFTGYLFHMFEERGIEMDLTEFDLIALGFLSEKE